MPVANLTKRTVDAAQPHKSRYMLFDAKLKGFGLRVYPSGEKSWVIEYRPGARGRKTSKRRYTIGPVGSLTPEEARTTAEKLLAQARLGADPVADRARERNASTFAELVETFINDHAKAKRKPRTALGYADILNRLVTPKLGTRKAADISRADVAKLHLKLKDTPVQADNMLTVVGTVYAFGSRRGLTPDGMNPAKGIERYGGARRERFLSDEELGRLGSAIREAETSGVPWGIDRNKPGAKHLPKDAEQRRNRISTHAAAALRLLILTGCRLREILHAKWANVDLERGILSLPDHKTIRSVGPKLVVLNAPAVRVLGDLERIGPYIISGDDPQRPRADLKRPWELVSKRAGLKNVRIHDLRHTHASVGAGSGIPLQLVGKLLGHSSPQVTARYAHVADDPLRRASNRIGARIAAAMGETGKPAPVAKIRQRT